MPQRLADTLHRIGVEMAQVQERGRVADYIPELGRIDPKRFGMAVVTADGREVQTGDADTSFSIQSVSKVFTLALALGKLGDQLWQRVGREPSGQAFDSILQLELEKGKPRNPFINAGALVTTDAVLAGATPREALGSILRFMRAAAEDEDIHIDADVARSEQKTGHGNYALAHYIASHDNLLHPPELVCGTYFHQCAIAMTCRQLARAGRFLMSAGQGPRLVSAGRVRRINALMMTCGQYDGSGDFAYRVGLPGKSGVGGGLLVIAPGQASIAVWSPGLDEQGNTLIGTLAVERLARAMGWSVFG
ncbi:glutaminase [Haematobacter missouriensis]|uniref:Glutaminase n=1 Tax=Haematobacter missouriensis TaxID=366616 RepID=A0A212AYA0_9RHOB|nr:glutaminase [Haematobacter missouriensis]KFI33187.1 glutaminase [Haematobacter missouriensis]OWJ70135.1 glutaminase [Haematobacter missouriensis]OWJ86451.1 glutaminase [Haematobacter missouriensis]